MNALAFRRRQPSRQLKRRTAWLLLSILAIVPVLSFAQEAQVDWWTISGGGELAVEGGPWTLSGTVGQWNVSVTAPQTGGEWALTGGFWVIASAGETEPPGDAIFSDGFEAAGG